MLLIPAIDLIKNQCVRLNKGLVINKIKFSKNPVLVFNKWINLGSKRIHIIDLEGAFKGFPKNLFMIKSILKWSNKEIKIQLGGGIRSIRLIKYYFSIGISYIILSTRVLLDINFLKYISYKFPNKIILSLDIKNYEIHISGWKKNLSFDLFKFLEKIRKFPIESIICTDINKDGTLGGINFQLVEDISDYINIPIICSGGLKNINDIKNIFNNQKNNLLGLICGKSIYKKNLSYYNIQNKINFINNIYINV